MSDTTDTTTNAPAAAPPPPAPAESLFKTEAQAPPATPVQTLPPGADDQSWLPEKYRVKGADGQLDLAASSKKLGEGYAAAERRIGTGDVRPDTPDAYRFTVPEALKDVPMDDALTKGFRDRAHKAGLTQAQYEFAMGEYFQLVPSLLDGAAKHSAQQARTELQKVWRSPAELEAGMNAAERAVATAPEGMREQLKERYGTDPLFFQFAAFFGKELQEDRPPKEGSTQGAGDVEALMASEAYRNQKHPEHKLVSAKVQQHFTKRYGVGAVM